MFQRHITIYEKDDYEALKKMDNSQILLHLITARNNLPESGYNGKDNYEGTKDDFVAFGMKYALNQAIEAYKAQLKKEIEA